MYDTQYRLVYKNGRSNSNIHSASVELLRSEMESRPGSYIQYPKSEIDARNDADLVLDMDKAESPND